jgi:glutathione S-transferase
MDLELISFKLCPFMQPSVITLLQHKVEHKITYIDINDPPPWFDELSPTGQVPILRVNNDQVIFESTIINEYLNEANNCNMMPDDPMQRALHRSWIQFCGSFFADIFNLIGGKDEAVVEDIEYDILEKLDQVEAIKSDTKCFNGDELSLIDTTFAALFMRLDLLKAGRNILDNSRYPKLNAWSEHLLSLDSVKNSVVPEFQQIYLGMVKMREGYISQSL